MCLVHQYEPELDKGIPRHIKDKKDSWEVDKADVKAKGFILQSIRTIILLIFISGNQEMNKQPSAFQESLGFSCVSKTCTI